SSLFCRNRRSAKALLRAKLKFLHLKAVWKKYKRIEAGQRLAPTALFARRRIAFDVHVVPFEQEFDHFLFQQFAI
ncbi:hypothetical protein HMPREF0072_0567, partial [Anaerococcus lactolyticus ATCC 51172]